MVTTFCFVGDFVKSLKEAYRFLKTDGFIIVGFVDKESELGKQYQLKKEESKFYRNATLYAVNETITLLRETNIQML